MIRFTKKFYTPENMVLSVVGPYSLKRVVESAKKYFGDFENSAASPVPLPFSSYLPTQKQVNYSNYQSHVVLGGLAFDLHHDKRLTMAFLTNVMGGPALNSKLSLAIREKHGMAYNVEANYSPFIDSGYHSIYFGTDKKWVDKSIELIHKELKKMKEIPMGRIQFSMAKEQLKGHLALAGESNANLMIGLGKSVLVFDKMDTSKELFAKIDAISTSDVIDVANEVYDEKQLSTLVFVPDREEE